jgi:hypothetical protein
MPRTFSGTTPHDLDDALAESDPAPFGVILHWIKPLVIRRHVLGPVARQGADKPVLISKVVAAVMQVHAVTMTRQGDITAMGIEARCCQHMRSVHRHACALWTVAA